MKKIQLSHITKEEYKLKISKGILIIPIGSTEQHAKHLPLGTDSIISENILVLNPHACNVLSISNV